VRNSLPTELLDEILTHLDFREAVRTSVLSRFWHHRWESNPAFSLSLLHRPGTLTLVVDNALVCHAGCISRLSVKVDLQSASHDCRDRDDVFRLHSSIFSCFHLVSLGAAKVQLPTPPYGIHRLPLTQGAETLHGPVRGRWRDAAGGYHSSITFA
jgi:hypothetical protein